MEFRYIEFRELINQKPLNSREPTRPKPRQLIYIRGGLLLEKTRGRVFRAKQPPVGPPVFSAVFPGAPTRMAAGCAAAKTAFGKASVRSRARHETRAGGARGPPKNRGGRGGGRSPRRAFLRALNSEGIFWQRKKPSD
jgi:hypothetical protein